LPATTIALSYISGSRVHKMRNKATILIIVTFIGFLIFPHLGTLLHIQGEGENLENRRLKPFPELNMKTIFSPSVGEELNDYVWDHLPLRTQLIEADHWMDYYIFKDSPVPDQVLIGRNGWLFFYPSVMTLPKEYADNVDKFVRAARKATRIGKKSGIEILIVPSPSKASIYPEYLTAHHREMYSTYEEMFQNHLEKAASSDTPSLLLLWEPFRKEKNRLLHEKHCEENQKSTCYLFRPKDRHFDWETAILQAKKIVERVAPGKWEDDIYKQYLTPYEDKPSEMERRFIRIDLPEPYIDFMAPEFLTSHSIRFKSVPVEGTARNKEVFTVDTNSGTDPMGKRVVVIHDSFFEKSKFFITPYFKETIFMHWSLSANMSSFLATVRSADILIIQGVDDSWYATYRVNRLQLIFNALKQGPTRLSSVAVYQ